MVFFKCMVTCLMFVRGILFGLFYLGGTLCLSLIMLLLYWMPRRYFSYFVRGWCYYFSMCAYVFLGIRYRVEGRENIPSSGHFLIASKHQSLWETMVFNCIFSDVAFVLKKELLNIPLFGIHLRKMKNIGVDRSQGVKALKYMHQSSVNMLSSGRSLVVFPEGTRVSPDVVGAKYHTGIYAIYKESQVPVLPVALNSGVYWRKGLIKRSGTITVRILPVIEPGLERDAFMSLIKKCVDEESYQLYLRDGIK